MKAKLLSILLAGATALTFTSCDDYFDDVPDNATSLEAVFANRGQSLKWLSNIYTYIPDNTNVRYNSRTNGCWPMASIEGYLPWDHIVANNIILGTLYPSTDFVKSQWTEYYRGIRMPTFIWQTLIRTALCWPTSASGVKPRCMPCAPTSTSTL